MACPKPRAGKLPKVSIGSERNAGSESSAKKTLGSKDAEELGVEEIRNIMQFGALLGSPPTTFLGVSPPTRSMGAANPLVQDAVWKCNARTASRSNLQALREMDAAGVSFLRSGSCGDYRLLIGSPEFDLLSEASDAEEYSHFVLRE